MRGLDGESGCPWGDFVLGSPSRGANLRLPAKYSPKGQVSHFKVDGEGLINLEWWGLIRRYYSGRGLPSHGHTKQPRRICSCGLVVVAKSHWLQLVIISTSLNRIGRVHN